MRIHHLPLLLGVFVAVVGDADAAERAVLESARDIPVAYEVDVVVVGGSSAGVAAAVEAAKQGAKVFVAAPRPYLGEDLCGTYRLWLEPGEEPESPLARKLFAEPPAPARIGQGLPFTYEASLPSAQPHRDTAPPSLLTDGHWANAYSESVQYDGDVTISIDLGGEQTLGRIHVVAFQRNGDIELERATVSTSLDGTDWQEAAVINNDQLGRGDYTDSALNLSVAIRGAARYVRVVAEKSDRVERLLLGEIVIESEAAADELPEGPRTPPMPMQVKHTLDQALIEAGAPFLFGCFVTDVLCDEDGNPAGIVMANRSGRQAVLAKVVIDATPRATVARLAGAKFRPYPAGSHTFRRVIVGGSPHQGDGVGVKPTPSPVQIDRGASSSVPYQEAFDYAINVSMPDGSFVAFADAEQVARDKTWDPGQVGTSEVLFQTPPDAIKARKRIRGPWRGPDVADLDAFRPAGLDRLYVLGGCADVSREAAERLVRPLALLEIGTRMGRAAADEASTVTRHPRDVRLARDRGKPTVTGGVLETLTGVRPSQRDVSTVPAVERALPVLGEYDVVIVGGGTGGAPAGIGAARHGARTLVIEYHHGLGGVGTLGLIGKYYYGYRKGFSLEVDRGVAELAGEHQPKSGWNVEAKMEWYRRSLREAGADIWFGTLGCGALVEDGRVKGVVVATPDGRGVVLAKVVIDSTGNSDIAAAAGASCIYTDGSHIAVQGTGMPPRKPGASYTNTDYTMTDESDVVDVWRTYVAGRTKYAEAYDMGQLIDTRERRRIVGEFVISPLDIFNRRTYPDSIGLSSSNFDTHGFTVHPLFTLSAPDKEAVAAYTPYRSLIPKGLDGILVTGLGISAHRDAMPILRMQADIQNQGYAAGTAAAMAVESGKSIRDIDLEALQAHLVEIGSLPESVLTDKDSYPMSVETVAAAVANVANGQREIGVILANPGKALPLLRDAYGAADADKLVYAHVLGMMGDATGVPTLIESVVSSDWDEGWTFTGGGQFGASVSPLDSRIIALGVTGDKRAVEPILNKVRALTPEHEFSHHRAVAVALEKLGDPRAAGPLAELLGKPGIMGHTQTDIDTAQQRTSTGNPNETRDLSLRELILARALYRCGDSDGLGEAILREYARDLRGHHARHASAVLAERE